MTNKRDDFTPKTIDILAKRVGYLCSNPNCKKHTVGPNNEASKITLIGIAAHITAASPGGPRYNADLSTEERKHINNGIWLCSNCASLIDKDEIAYPIKTLLDWKENAEQEMRNALLGESQIVESKIDIPFIEADLIWSHCSRFNRGYSEKNIQKFGGNLIPFGSYPIIHWDLEWNLSLVLHNNSRFPAFNIKIEHINGIGFAYLPSLPRINNLPPYASIDLNAKFYDSIEGTTIEADKELLKSIPEKLNETQYRISYLDENRNEHFSILCISNENIKTEKQ